MFTQLLLVLALAISRQPLSAADCAAELQAFTACDKEEVSARIEAANKEPDQTSLLAQIDDCYKPFGCSAPNWSGEIDADLTGKAKNLWKNITDWWHNIDNSKRHCVIADVRGDFGQSLEACISKKIPGFDLKEPSLDTYSLNEAQKTSLRKIAEHRLKIDVADNNCINGTKWKELRDCRKKVRDAAETQACDVRAKCAKSISDDCRKVWDVKIREPICDCVLEVATDFRQIFKEPVGKSDAQVGAKCLVEKPTIDEQYLKANPNLHHRIKQFVAFHEDRIISFCHTCKDVNI